MRPIEEFVDDQLAALAQSTLSAAPQPRSADLVLILAVRRHAQLHSKRLSSLVAAVNLAPLLILTLGWALRPPGVSGVAPVAILASLALLTALVATQLVAGARAGNGRVDLTTSPR